MFTWNKPPSGGKEHTDLWKIFIQKAKKGLIKGIPQGYVYTEEQPKGFLASRPDGVMYKEGCSMIWFEIETDWWNGLYKVAKYSFVNMIPKKGCKISDLIIITKADWIMDAVKCKLRDWLNKMEDIGDFKIRWFIIDSNTRSICELKNCGELERIDV